MSIEACADLVKRGDPERFQAVMATPVAHRARLFVLYAFNLEVARAPWVTKEPMIAEMRLQWWRDVVAEPQARAHDVAGPLHSVIKEAALPVDAFDQLIGARRWDVYSDAFEDAAHFDRYLNETAGGLMWLAAKACGAPETIEPAARDFGWAAGLANFLRAVPELEARGKIPLVDGRGKAVRELAAKGLAKIGQARRHQKPLWPAMLAGWQAEALLIRVLKDPQAVADGAMGLSEFQLRGRLAWSAISGRW